MNRFLKQLHQIEFSRIWHKTSCFSISPQLLNISPQTDTTKCPLSLQDCSMATTGTTPARQLWEKFQTLVPCPCKNSTWEFTKIRTSRRTIEELMKDYLFFPHRDKDHGNVASNKRIYQLERTWVRFLHSTVLWEKSQYCLLMVLLRAVINSTKNCNPCIWRCDYNTSELFLFNWLRYLTMSQTLLSAECSHQEQ